MSAPQTAGPIDIYARLSRKGDKQQRSTSGQVGACRAVLAERGLTAGEVLVDDGKSAWNPRVERKDWDRLMARLESGAAAGVIVFDLERFSRQPAEGERLIAAAERGMLVLDSDAEFDLTSASGKKSFRDAMAAAAYYSDRLSDRVKRGKRAKAMAGQVDGAGWQDRPFGWESDGITQRPAEAAILREAAARFLAGESQDSIVDDLNARGITTSQGKPWRRTGLRELLLRERNRGNIEHRGVVVAQLPGEPVIDSATFGRIAAKYAARRPGRPFTRTYLCSGAAVCAACRHPLATRPVPRRRPYPDGEVARQYWCKKYTGGCGTVHVDQRDLDAAARELAIAILSDPRHAAQVEAAAARHAEEATALDSLIADAEQTALAMADRLGRGEVTLDRYDAITKPLDTRLAGLRGQREALNGAPGPVPAADSRAGWVTRWENAAHDERRALLRTALRGRVLVVGPADPADRADVTRRLTLEPSQPVA
jgi:DNA invertase Pin-like site-specific DNA recombinase